MVEVLHYYDVAEGKTRELSAREIRKLAQEDGSVLLIRGMRGVPPSTFQRVALAVARRKMRREEDRIDAMIDAYLDTDAFNQVEAQIDDDNARLRAEFAREFEMLTSSQVHVRSGSASKNKAATASDWKRALKVFSVKIQGRELYPGFQFDADGRPLPLMNSVLTHLQSELSPWQIAFWLVSPQNSLDGRLPIDLVRDGDAGVVEAAKHAYELSAG